MIKKTAGIIMSILLTISITAGCGDGSAEELKVFAVKYGVSQFPEKFLFHGSKNSITRPFTWMFYYIEFRERKILVDTGFRNEKLVKMFDITDYTDPLQILKENGINPESITDIIITHSHFDHIGNVHRFPNARIIINKRELQSLINGKGMNEVRNYLKVSSGVVTFDDSISFLDFFRIQRIGGHTEGSSVVHFNYKGLPYCLAGDEFYLEENLISETGSGSVVNHSKNMSFLKELKKNGAKTFLFHDNRYYAENKNFIQVLP